METPFTSEQFFEVFERYNVGMFPSQILILILGIAGILLIQTRNPIKNKSIGGLLGLLWLWMGLVYHIGYFSSINKAAYVFGGLFILQGLFILYEAYIKNRLIFRFKGQFMDYLGYFFILFGLFIYPVISLAIEQSLARTIALGLPCPSTILTFGFLMLTDKKLTGYLLIIPSIWAVIGLSAAINFGVNQDLMMPVAAIFADWLIISRKKNHHDKV